MIRSPSYFLWSRTFLLGVGLTYLSHFGRYFGQNKAVVSVFNGSEVYCNAGIVLIFLARAVVIVKHFASTYFEKKKNWPLNTAEILCPEVNVRSSHKIQTTLIRRSGIAREVAA
jgi:hypothetical protein